MESKNLNEEDNAKWSALLQNYEREPSIRAKRLFQSKLATRQARGYHPWVWGLAASVVVVGSWFFWAGGETIETPIAQVRIKSKKTIVPTLEQRVPEVRIASGSLGLDEARLKERQVNNFPISTYAAKSLLSINQEAAPFISEDASEDRTSWRVGPVASLSPREIPVVGSRGVDVKYSASEGQLTSGESSRKTVSQLLDELMILKYGEPVDERPVLAVLFSGDEPSLLATERAEFKERISWIKEKVVK